MREGRAAEGVVSTALSAPFFFQTLFIRPGVVEEFNFSKNSAA